MQSSSTGIYNYLVHITPWTIALVFLQSLVNFFAPQNQTKMNQKVTLGRSKSKS